MRTRTLIFLLSATAIFAGMLFAFRFANTLPYLNTYLVRFNPGEAPLLGDKWSEFLFFGASILTSLLLFDRGRRVAAVIVLSMGLLWLFLESSLFLYLRDLGVDSVLESREFDRQEAVAWFDAFRTSIGHFLNQQFLKDLLLKLFTYGMAGLLAFGLLELLRRRMGPDRRDAGIIVSVFCAAALCMSLYLRGEAAVRLWRANSEMVGELLGNFSNPPPPMEHDGRDITVVAYIGESTTVMNMGLYNAPEDNMPQLTGLQRTDSGFMLFRNLFATHSHTSQSLLEAFSLAARPGEDHLPINRRHRISLVDMLHANGVVTSLVSNQGQTGSSNRTASVVFRKADRKVYSTSSRLTGNFAKEIDRPYDHVFFGDRLPALLQETTTRKKFIALHSYAGHSNYELFIPDSFNVPNASDLGRMDPEAVVGDIRVRPGKIDAYRHCIPYIDHSVSRVIANVSSRPDPVVLLYFSDHGESVLSGRGHESNNFIHEMLRVPFVMYFNEAARSRYPELYRKYRMLSRQGNAATLAQLPSTLLELFGIRNMAAPDVFPGMTPVVGEALDRLPPVLVREMSDSITYVELNGIPVGPPTSPQGVRTVDRTDMATRIYALTRAKRDIGTRFCYHRSNTYAKALRASLVCDCIESDLVVQPDGALSLTHPPKPDVGLRLEDVHRIAVRNNMALWIDSKNLDSHANAQRLLRFLRDKGAKSGGILVEFPSGSHLSKDSLRSVTDSMHMMGYATSYYVPTQVARKCRAAFDSGVDLGQAAACRELEADLRKALESGLFTDFSFQYGAFELLKRMPFTQSLRWNTWGMPEDSVRALQPGRFRMVILQNDDPNTR